jgi:hypothetical protein
VLARDALGAGGVPVAGPPVLRFMGGWDLVTVETGFPVPAGIPDLGDVTGRRTSRTVPRFVLPYQPT